MTEPIASEFEVSLEEAIRWCGPRANAADAKPRWSLRSSELRPIDLHGNRAADDPTLFLKEAFVERVVLARRAALAKGLQASLDPAARAGKVLLTRFSNSNENYAASESSDGFFDGNDLPPWDTWVGIWRDALVSWVPLGFVGCAGSGIAVEGFNTLDWAVDCEDEIPAWLLTMAKRVETQDRA